ncbi:unnamed protein product [Adineta steineri]|uniref:Uncharacterized protein n=1 Tax=Adineta steineri TaxID=433720 RepID=A0A815FPX6_9BILA|nr:unnamed protein product [Adineta steineri]CAF1322079.1 unnamed protein product [Adineta steineri]CAF1584681.1 unnamed protein product [Adineta steineri]CAF1584867.1 unnamed protein product [Adineta steineri]
MIVEFGMVAGGLVLGRVKELNVFRKITEIYILVPVLLGLKGNLEMTLASRLSTQVCSLILDFTVFQPAMNDVGDNLVAVQASRLSTTLHQQDKLGEFQDITQYHASKFCRNSYKILYSTTILLIEFSIVL